MRRRYGIAGAFAAYGLAVASLGSRLPELKADLHLSAGTLSLALFGVPVGQVLALRYAPRVVDRRTSRWLARASMLAVGVGIVLPGLATRRR